MKYMVELNGTEGNRFAKEVESKLKSGICVNWKNSNGMTIGRIEMVGWPTFHGEQIKDGESLILLEDSFLKAIRAWACFAFKCCEGFKFGWPRNLVVMDP